MYRIIAAALAASSCAQAALAADIAIAVPARVLTLQEALEKAGAASPAIEASTAGVRAAAAQRSVAAQRPNPTLVAETENVTGSGPYDGIRSAETTVSLALPLERGGKRSARIAVADAQRGRATLEAAIAAADLGLRVTQAYTAAAAAQRRLVTAREQVAIATEGLRAARLRVAAGKASPIEEQRADVARMNATSAFEQAERAVDLALGNLSRLVGMPVTHVDLAWFGRITGPGPALPLDTAETLAAAAARADLSIASAQARLARAQVVPDVTLTAGARRFEVGSDIAAVLGFSIPLRLFNSGRAAVDVAAAQQDQAEALRRLAALDVEQAIAIAKVDLANAETGVRNAGGPALAAAEEAARIARIGYREGKFGQLDLLDAQRTLLDTRTAAINSLAAYHDAQARLDRLTARAPTTMEDNR
jgi:cobalt-zinc-cadmium efflux system outer membrane protein